MILRGQCLFFGNGDGWLMVSEWQRYDYGLDMDSGGYGRCMCTGYMSQIVNTRRLLGQMDRFVVSCCLLLIDTT